MEQLIINYKVKDRFWYLLFILSILTGVLSLIIGFKEIRVENYSILFYYSLLLLLFSIGVMIYLNLWKPKPLILIDKDIFQANIDNQSPINIDWTDIKDIAVGISTIRINTINSKSYIIDLKEIKYEDIKKIKSTIIEICENKNIAYINDY